MHTMNNEQLFQQALVQIRQGSIASALEVLSALAEQRHIPATFVFADTLFRTEPDKAISYLTGKFHEGLIGAAFRAVLMKVFFKKDAMTADDVSLLYQEALKQHQEAILVLTHLSENTQFHRFFVEMVNRHIPEAANLLHLPEISADEQFLIQPNTEHFELISKKFNTFIELKPILQVSDIGVCLYQNVFSTMMCRHFVLKFNSQMKPSMVYDPASGRGEPNPVRTSTYLQVTNENIDWFVLEAERRLAQLSGVETTFGEPLSVLQYSVGQEYKPHYDAFVGDDKALSSMLEDGGQRVKTMICYLQSANEGGETAFIRKGIKLNPPPGSVLIFNNTDNHGIVLKDSYHAGMPVKSGTKWIMTKWIRAQQTRYGQSLYL